VFRPRLVLLVLLALLILVLLLSRVCPGRWCKQCPWPAALLPHVRGRVHRLGWRRGLGLGVLQLLLTVLLLLPVLLLVRVLVSLLGLLLMPLLLRPLLLLPPLLLLLMPSAAASSSILGRVVVEAVLVAQHRCSARGETCGPALPGPSSARAEEENAGNLTGPGKTWAAAAPTN
jgi:hypothetical protein